MSAADLTLGACNGTSVEQYIASGVGVASSLVTISAVLIGRAWVKATHRFFIYYSAAAALLSASELSESLTCAVRSAPELYRANVCVTCYFNAALVLLLCWVSAYLLLVGVYQQARLRRWQSEAGSMVLVLVLPLGCAWKGFYDLNPPSVRRPYYGCGPSGADSGEASYVDVSIASVEFLLRIVGVAAAGATFVKLVAGSCDRGGPYHRSYVKAFRTLLPFFVFLLVANVTGTLSFALSVMAASWRNCPASLYPIRDLFPLTFVSLPVCYAFLVCKARCGSKESVVDSISVTTAVSDQL